MSRATANLVVSPDVAAAVAAVPADAPATLVVLTVDPKAATVNLSRTQAVEVTGDASSAAASALAAAFPAILGACTDAKAPLLFLVRAKTDMAVADSRHEWVIVSYVPDTTHPKQKMVYAAAKDDVRKALDDVRSSVAYHVTDLDELTYAAFSTWRDRSDRSAAMSNWELQKAAVVKEAETVRAAAPARLAGMQTVAFTVSDEVLHALQALQPGKEEPAAPAESGVPDAAADAPAEGADAAAPSTPVRPSTHSRVEASLAFVELSVTGESVNVVSKDDGAAKEVTDAVDRIIASAGKEPRYFALRVAHSAGVGSPGGGATEGPAASPTLVYYCPEDSVPRSRMRYSTAKAALLSGASNAGVAFSRVVEAHDKEDLTSALQEIADGKTAGGAETESPASAHGRTRSAGVPLMGMGSPPHAHHRAVSEMAGVSPSSAASGEGGYERPARPGRGGARLLGMGGGIALPGMGSPPSS